MILYLASLEKHNLPSLKDGINALFSFYDLTCESLPFRKETYEILKGESNED